MTSVFDRRFKKTGFPVLLAQFGEPITYHLNAGGDRSIDAIIERSPPAFYNAAGEVVLPDFAIRIYNDCKTGVLASEVDIGGDEVSLIEELGDSVLARKTVIKMVSQDSGVIHLMLK